ncbi:MAG: isoprenylcysteine carboxylmethyltransferase family protein [Bacteroidetes bacterium]|nr:MAG: isoprenylcysteine carboxylmethyltransferase family protein [Bacteroidota bacterium]
MRQKLLIKSGNFFFKLRNALFPLFIVSLLLFTKPGLFLENETADKLAVGAGFITALLGVVFRCIVIGFAYIKRGGRDGKVYAENLVTKGFYNHVRNPMYIGNFLILTGLGMIYGSIYVYIAVIPLFAFIYLSIVITEENYLREHFGKEYEEYCKRVPRFMPNLSGLKESLKEFHYDWRKAIRKDYGTFFGTIVGCYAILLIKKRLLYGFPRNINDITGPLIVFLLLAAGYILLRFLKKRGKLKQSAG